MKKIFKKIAAVLTSAAMLFSAMPLEISEFIQPVLTASAANSGTCGENIAWEFDDSGTLHFNGTGKMQDYGSNYDDSSAPWVMNATLNSNIKAITFSEGITQIGNNAFFAGQTGHLQIPHSLYNLETVTLPDSLESIGENAFFGCNSLSEIDLSQNVSYIGSFAFYVSSVKDIYIRNKACEIYDYQGTLGSAVIHGYEGSTAQSYAQKYNYKFIPIIDETITDESNDIWQTLYAEKLREYSSGYQFAIIYLDNDDIPEMITLSPKAEVMLYNIHNNQINSIFLDKQGWNTTIEYKERGNYLTTLVPHLGSLTVSIINGYFVSPSPYGCSSYELQPVTFNPINESAISEFCSTSKTDDKNSVETDPYRWDMVLLENDEPIKMELNIPAKLYQKYWAGTLGGAYHGYSMQKDHSEIDVQLSKMPQDCKDLDIYSDPIRKGMKEPLYNSQDDVKDISIHSEEDIIIQDINWKLFEYSSILCRMESGEELAREKSGLFLVTMINEYILTVQLECNSEDYAENSILYRDIISTMRINGYTSDTIHTVTTTQKATTTTMTTATTAKIEKPPCHQAIMNSDYTQYYIPIRSDQILDTYFLSGYSADNQLDDGIVYISIEDACKLVGAEMIDTGSSDCVVVNRNTVTWSCSISDNKKQYLLIDDNTGKGDYFEAAADSTADKKRGFKAWTYRPYEDMAVTWNMDHEKTAVPVVCESESLFVSLYDFSYVFGADMKFVSTNISETLQNTKHILESCGFTIESDETSILEQYISDTYAPYQDYEYFVECVAGLPVDALYQQYFDSGTGLQCDFAEYYSNEDLETANIIRAAKDFGIYDSVKALWNLDTQFDEQLTGILLYQPNGGNIDEPSDMDKAILGIDTLGLYGGIEGLEGNSAGIVGLINKPIVKVSSKIGTIDFSAFDFVSPIPGSIQTYLKYISTYDQLSNATEDLSGMINAALIQNPALGDEKKEEYKEIPKYFIPGYGGILRGKETVLREKNSAINLYHSACDVQETIDSDEWQAYMDGVLQALDKYSTDLIDTIAVKAIDTYLFGGAPLTETLYACLQSAQHSDLFETDPFLSDCINISYMDDYIFIQDIAADGIDNYGWRSDERFLCFVFDVKASMLAFASFRENNPDAANDKLTALNNLYNESYRVDVNKNYYNQLFKSLSAKDRLDFKMILGDSDVLYVDIWTQNSSEQ